MKKLLLATFLFIGTWPFVFGQLRSGDNTKKVAILEVVDKENKIGYAVKLMLRTSIAEAITNTSGYEGYDRVDIASIMNEHEFQRTGMVSNEQIKKLGAMTGAAYILVAEAAVVDNNHLYITAKILNVETAKLEKTTKEMSGVTPEEFDAACAKLAAKLLNGSVPSSSSSPSYSGYSSGQDYVENAFGINMQMVYVEGGDFLMGCTLEQDCDQYASEPRRVNLDSYYIGKMEVTQKQWELVMGTNLQQQWAKREGTLPWAEHPNEDMKGLGPDYPMYFVSWKEAMAFCEELSRKTGHTYTLPNSAQWEYAARGGVKQTNTKYSGSNSLDGVAWYGLDYDYGSAHRVGSKRANELGIHDMSGNVWEWCVDHPWRETGLYVLRGGSWHSKPNHCRVSEYSWGYPDRHNHSFGFRVVMIP